MKAFVVSTAMRLASYSDETQFFTRWRLIRVKIPPILTACSLPEFEDHTQGYR